MATAAGLAVAGLFYAQPLLDQIAADLGIERDQVGVIFAATQLGYGLGLVALVPLGDILDRRRLIVAHMALFAAMLALVAAAPGAALFLAGLAAVGALAVVAQLLVAHAAGLSEASSRGRAVGSVTVGIIAGVVLARIVAGVLAESLGWRAVFAAAAGLTAGLAGLLWRVLPAQARPSARSSYPRVIASVFALLRADPMLRSRALLAYLVFSTITGLWTPMALELRAPPHELGYATIGLFGLSGLISAVGAAQAGRWADRGLAQPTTGRALGLMLCAWVPISLLPISIWGLVIGSLMVEVGLQIVHVSNQSLAYREHPDAKSRLAAAYMLFYALGCASGAVVSTFVYARTGWAGVCLLGAVTTSVALATWASTRRTRPGTTRACARTSA